MVEFKDLGLPSALLKAVEKLGFTTPMPIQAEAIPALLVEDPPDCVALAATGTGKTCGYGLPMLAHLDAAAAEVQGLILAPTRELCLQIGEELARFAKYLEHVHVVACYGGAPIGQQIVKLSRGAQVVVATPGRLCDLIRREAISLETVKTCVLDEADEMLNLGFREELSFILDAVPKGAAMWLFSATMPPEVEAIAKTYISDPLEITVGTKNETQANIVHHAYAVAEHNRYGALRRVIDFVPEMYGLVFCRTRVDTQRLSETLMHEGVYAEALHGDLSQAQRDSVMRKFREKAVRILVATDVAARGLDVDDISHVIHYHLPDDPAVYTHRSGRTARAGKSGISISLVTPREKHRLRLIERICGMRFEQRSIPTPEEVRQKHVFWLAEQVRTTTEIHPAILELLPAVSPMMTGLSSEEVLARILQLRLSTLMDAYKDAKDINPAQRVVDKAERDAAFGERQRIMIHVGRLDHLKEGAVVRLACEHAGIQASDIGAISIKREFAFFDVRAELGRRVLSALQNVDFDGRPLNPKWVDPVEDLHEKKPKKSFQKKFSEKRGDKRGGKPFKKDGKGAFKKGEKAFKKGGKAFQKAGKKGGGKGAQHA
ncbi:MAG: DEAD/DEAH box helicase [bacterium]|nr:DEAD/DEAH box helicase [bacterium]